MSSLIQYSRRNLPDIHRNLATWPTVDVDALEPQVREIFQARQRAVRAYLNGHALARIKLDTTLGHSEVHRHFNRCLQLHEDGRIFGWRALLPWKHTGEYRRLTSGAGVAGKFSQFLSDHPALREKLDELILTKKRHDALRESRYSHREVYGHFRRLCVRTGVSETAYPLNSADRGQRAIRRYALKLLRQHFSAEAARRGGATARERARIGRGLQAAFAGEAPFDLVSIDAHKLDFIGCIAIPTPDGPQRIAIDRLNFIPVLEEHSTAVLGYEVAVGREASAQHVVAAVKHALSPWRPRASVSGINYPEGASMPSAAVPKSLGLCWNALLLDNASIHYSVAVAEQLRRRVGCAINFGPVGQWCRRPLVESLFSSLERRGFLRLPNSTGTGPNDPLRRDAVAQALKFDISLEDMRALIDVIVCTYNATPRDSLGGLSPLERLANALLMASTTWLPRRLPTLPMQVPELGVETLELPVRGDRKKGRHPYVQYLGVHYSSPLLSQTADLLGQKIRVHITANDLRAMTAFYPDGTELGILNATSGWRHTPHNRELRREVLKEVAANRLVVGPEDDPIQSYMVAKGAQALRQQANRGSRRATVSREGTALAKATAISGQEVPEIPESSLAEELPPFPSSNSITPPLPSFVPRIRHRGTKS